MRERSRTSDERFLKKMFREISGDYDFLNRLLTFGLDRQWRDRAASLCNPRDDVLDLCCGTGKMLSAIMSSADDISMRVGVDFLPEMIALAGTDCARRFVIADAARLPFRAESFDCVTIAFSLRNLLYKGFEDYMIEVLRILRQGGRLLVLETSQPEQGVIRELYHLYLRNVVPLVGGLISGSKRAYKYLSLSALNHPTPRDISTKLASFGFRRVEFTSLSFGIVSIHIASK